MSLFSRLFGKTSSQSPASTPKPTPSESTRAKPNAADRALIDHAEEKALQSAIESGNAQAVAKLVIEGASNKIRQAAAQAIEDPEVLRQLIRDVRGGNDKNVYKILTAKRDVLLEQARKLEEVRTEIAAVSEVLERHSQRIYDELYGPRLEQFESRWAAVVAQATPELRDKVQQWIDRSRENIAEHLRQIADKASREQAAADAAAEARRLREEQAQASAAEATERTRVHGEQKHAVAEEQQAEQDSAREISELIRKARGALNGGNTSRAAGVRWTIDEKLAGAEPLPAQLASQLQQLDKQIDDLKDWKSFSVAPKRAELIEEMQSLIGAEMEPQELADRIKSLQDEWRVLGKGAGDAAEEDWQRFQDAGQKAYLPCVEYFAEKAAIREANLRQRDALLARLTAFEAGQNWEQADWKAVVKNLRDAKQEWRGYSPVDHKAGRKQQEGFSALVTSLQERLDAEYARNVQQKESLIERAQALLAGDDVRKAIDAIKGLQQQWQAVGPVPREADQRMWEQFRQHTDAVFQKRQDESAAFKAGLENNKAQAVALCEQIEQIAALEGAELLARAKTVGELQNAFEALGEFPRADTLELRKRLERGLERCKKSVARQHVRDAERSWTDLFDAANHVRAYKLAAARGSDSAQLDALRTAAETRISSVQKWPKRGLETLKQGLARERPEDLAANEKALKMLCIRAEILTDTATPSEDQALRREYQLQRLVQNIGQGLKVDEAQLDTMVIEWIDVGPVEDAAYTSLLQRFQHCREKDKTKAS